MMINPLVQLLGVELTDSMPGLPTVDGAPKGLFAALFGEQQAALLAETTGAPVLLWPDGTLSAVVEGEPIPPGALLVLPDGTRMAAFAKPEAELEMGMEPETEAELPSPVAAVPEPAGEEGETPGKGVPSAVPVVAASPQPAETPVKGGSKPETGQTPAQPAPKPATPNAQESMAQSASARRQAPISMGPKPVPVETVDGKPIPPPSQADAGKTAPGKTAPGKAVPASASGILGAAMASESSVSGRQGGAGAFAASVFAAQSAQLETGLARDAVRVMAATVHDGEPLPQSFARTDAVRPAGEAAPLTGQTPSPTGTTGLEARSEAAAMRAGIMAERPTLNTVGDFTVRAVRVLAADGEHSMTVRLVPESLGELRLTVRTTGDSVQLHVVAASMAVRDALDGQMQGLRDALSREGIDLSRVTIGSDTAGQQASARHSGGETNGAHGNGRPVAGDSPHHADESLDPAKAYGVPPRAPDAVLDLFA